MKIAIRKGHTSFLVFKFWDLKLLRTASTLYTVSGNPTYFFQKCRRGIKKSSRT